ncbi:nematocyst expressed protein 3-like [Schistocerca americana]|uniref:nematocyst expressed protein 3-like n=1 Tax=Schistocerca americana TaxID=7009 RepID=UPI001F4FB4AD|nr:nematocyst expressed protein 3-like [Schistocerca americana]
MVPRDRRSTLGGKKQWNAAALPESGDRTEDQYNSWGPGGGVRGSGTQRPASRCNLFAAQPPAGRPALAVPRSRRLPAASIAAAAAAAPPLPRVRSWPPPGRTHYATAHSTSPASGWPETAESRPASSVQRQRLAPARSAPGGGACGGGGPPSVSARPAAAPPDDRCRAALDIAAEKKRRGLAMRPYV